jgi:acetyl-CoA carboxylase alpha subunit
LDQNSAYKKLDKQVKDLKAKCMLAENLAAKRSQELDAMKAKLEKRLQEDEKSIIRDKSAFEKAFGRAPSQRQSDDKYLGFMRSYENQRDRLER